MNNKETEKERWLEDKNDLWKIKQNGELKVIEANREK